MASYAAKVMRQDEQTFLYAAIQLRMMAATGQPKRRCTVEKKSRTLWQMRDKSFLPHQKVQLIPGIYSKALKLAL